MFSRYSSSKRDLRSIAELARWAGANVVISGSVDEVRWRFQALGVTDFLSKPVSLDELVDCIRRLLREAPARRPERARCRG